jgi:hypothetical protein
MRTKKAKVSIRGFEVVLDGRAITSYTRWVDAVEVMGDQAM